jgi:hypothetical protein
MLGRWKHHIEEPLVPEVEIAIAKLKRYESPRTEQIPTELIEAGGKTLCCELNRLINSIRKKEDLLEQ